MSTLQVGAVVLVVAVNALFAYQVRLLWQAVQWLHEHEQAHCDQVGELQRHVAALVVALNGATHVPPEIIEYAARMLDAQD